jgi:2-polyprenyl-6-methoxyphenol hydroxylase-like FAD-dependent oxidoreductase
MSGWVAGSAAWRGPCRAVHVMASPQEIETTCCIAGGGPAGMMLGFLLARAGVDVVVLEKHPDFNRDFRGDTVHPSTLDVMGELGLLDSFLRLPHQEVRSVTISFEGRELRGPDFSHLPTRCKFIALMPQWDLLNFIAEQARRFPGFTLRMQAAVTDLIEENGRIAGVVASTGEGELRVRAALVVATDGRHSTVCQRAGLEARDYGVPIDVLWFRVATHGDEPSPSLGRVQNGKLLVTIPRGDYYQCGFIIRKATFPAIQAEGLAAFRAEVGKIAPFLREGAAALQGWDEVKLLTVQVNRLPRWHRPGLLCIGDAAHAMSPAFGVGINYAIQDAVATANLLAAQLKAGTPLTADDLDQVQRRRQTPVRRMQAIQVFLHRRTFGDAAGQKAISFGWPVRLLIGLAAPLLRRVAARIVGLGFLPEHVATPEASRGGA